MKRKLLSIGLATLFGMAFASAAFAAEPAGAAGSASSSASATASEVSPEAGGSTGSTGAAMQGGGPTGGSNPTGKKTLQQDMKECEGLSGSAFARCQEQVLANHPGEW